MTTIPYDTLSPLESQIRIITLHPGRWSSPISCTIQTIPLPDNGNPNNNPYDALSYVWGNPQDTAPLTINNSFPNTSPSTFHATKNLISALRRLRSSTNPKSLWVDAICINQADVQEKTRQVSLMAHIYKSARTVYVFLGESRVLDLVSDEEQAEWDDSPMFSWKRDFTMLMQTDQAPSRVGVDTSRNAIVDMGAYMRSALPDEQGYEPVDTLESPMWVVWEPEGGLDPTDQRRVDEFFQRQHRQVAQNVRHAANFNREPSHSDSGNATPPHDALQTLRENQAGAFAIMKVLSNGGCLKHCLPSPATADSSAWTGALDVLHHLTNLPWWTRVWVLQEAILPQRNVLAIYGEIVAPIGLIEDSGAILPRHHERGVCCKPFWNSLPPAQQHVLEAFAEKMSQLESIRETLALTTDEQLNRLHFLLENTRFKEATDPRDKVYGLLGLLNGSSNPVDGLIPDYQLPVADLYVSVAMKFIHHHLNLSILVNNEPKTAGNGPPNIPSWVPHWGPTYGPFTSNLLSQRLSKFIAWPSGVGPMPALVPDSHVLAVRAKFISRVVAVTEAVVKEQHADTLGFLLSTLEFFFGLDTVGSEEAPYPFKPKYASTQESVSMAFARTMMGDLFYSIDHIYKTGRITFDRAYEGDANMFRFAHRVMLADVLGGPKPVLIMPDGIEFPEKGIAHIIQTAEENFWYANEGKVFFRTEHGHFGSGPHDTSKGDEVHVVFGSSVPLVLRRLDGAGNRGLVPSEVEETDCRTLVGHAYVHGIMDGEDAPVAADAAEPEVGCDDGAVQVYLV